jgi:glutamate--cysteine ligase
LGGHVIIANPTTEFINLLQHHQKIVRRLLDAGIAPLFRMGRIGLEKECLRVNAEGKIAQTAHPEALGSPLTHPYITTDYSEALLELITPPCESGAEALAFLSDVQCFVYARLQNELLWSTSMPCVIPGESSIPLARYGSSNAGTMKTVYRRGLGYRYGRTMQVIAGVHFNYSFGDDFWLALQQFEGDERPLQEYISSRYFDLLRNMLRIGWLIPYLFGASPAVCKSFVGGEEGRLESFDEFTFYAPYATSLRMGDIGYQNNKENENGIKANYDSLDKYVSSLEAAIDTPCPEYQRIGIKVDGEYRQLNANILQIENEYYSTVRPKQILQGNEKPIRALQREGVRYIELRSLDVNGFEPLGINEGQLRFLETLMLYCLLRPSPPISAIERREIDYNELETAHRGREPGLNLMRCGTATSLQGWALEVCEAMTLYAELLDGDDEGRPYSESVAQQREAAVNPELTPSARMLAEMRENEESFFGFARRQSQIHQQYFVEQSLSAEREAMFQGEATSSLQRQQQIEAADDVDFDHYLQAYFAR